MSGSPLPRAELETLLGSEAVLAAAAECAPFGADLAGAGVAPALVLRPARRGLVAPALALLTRAGIASAPRGAGLSYTGGALPAEGPWVAFDLRSLDRILEINALDGYVTVEAGCSWRSLEAALAARDLRAPFWGPASGHHATIGGTLAQDAVLYGSGRYGAAAGSVLSLTVACADGRTIATGSAAAGGRASPFLRGFGPDLTGLFIGDCGALGIKLDATLRVMPRPRARRSGAWRFADLARAAGALAALGAAQHPSECLLVGSASSGPRECVLDFIVEARTEAQADLEYSAAGDICRTQGGERCGEGALRAWRDAPFPDLASLAGEPGQRWIPVHALLPHSALPEAAQAIDAILTRASAALAHLALSWHWVALLAGPGAALIEPSLLWREAASPAPRSAPDPGIAALRAELARALGALGGVHLQVGRFYSYAPRLEPAARSLLEAIRRELDPRGCLNPGVLGLGG